MHKGILLSGGIDSTSLAFWKKPEYAFTIDYGQKPAQAEINASKVVCDIIGVRHTVIQVDCRQLGSGDLLQKDALTIAPSSEWWPYRNQLLVTFASMKAVEVGVEELMVGSVQSDGFHKDGTEEFYELLNNLMLFQEGSMRISAPAINLSTMDLILKSGIRPEVLYYSHSCHKSDIPCGHCKGCYKYIGIIEKLKDGGWEKP